MNEGSGKPALNIGRVLGIIFIVYFVASVLALLVMTTGPAFDAGNVALIDVSGIITVSGTPETLFSAGVLGAEDYVALIEEADTDDRYDAIVLRIDSGGGSPVGSRLIVEAVSEAEKPVIAYVREIGASGAYWVAAASDEIIADPLAITGSVGVQASYLEFSGLLERYNVTYVNLTGGRYKDLGSPLDELAPDERELLEDRIDYLHDYFFGSVVELRNLSDRPDEDLETIRSGLYFIGDEAVGLGLVDSLGSWDAVEESLQERGIEDVEYAELRQDRSPLSGLAGFSASIGKAIGEGIGTTLETKQPTLT